MNTQEEMFVRCICHSPEHQMLLSFWSNEKDEELYITFYLSQYRNIFKRVWVAIRYIFGYRSRYGDWDEILLNKQKASELARFIDKYLENQP